MDKKLKRFLPTIFFAVLFNPAVLYGVWIVAHAALRLSHYGNVNKNGLIMIIIGILFILWFILWLILYKNMKRKLYGHYGRKILWRSLLVTEIIALAIIIGNCGYLVYQDSKDITTKLGWYLHERNNTMKFVIQADNLYEDGIRSLYQELDNKLNLPDVLYTMNVVQIDYDEEGTIDYIYAYLYGKNEQGDQKSYLIDYDTAKSEKVTVWLDGQNTATNNTDRVLFPMVEIVDKLDLKVLSTSSESYSIRYSGKKTIPAVNATLYLLNDMGVYQPTTENTTGYVVSLSSKQENTVPMHFFVAWNMDLGNLPESYEVIEEEPKTQHDGGISYSDGSEDRYFYISNEIGYALKVVDAAAGSRFYQFNKTIDGGDSWEIVNPDPFEGNAGSHVDLIFYNDTLGFLLLPNASNSYSRLYRTEDGGITFQLLSWSGVIGEDYDYPSLPITVDGDMILSIGKGMEGESIEDVVILKSDDKGMTWKEN